MDNAKPWQTTMFYALTLLFWMSLYTYQPTMSPYLESEGVSYSMIGLIGGSYGFTQMLLRIPLGVLSDRLGRRKIFIIGGVFISALSSLILYFAKDPFIILLGRSLAGVAASAWVIFTILFSSFFSKEKRASSISYLVMCNNAGQVSAMLIGGVTAGYLGYRFPFLLGAVAGALGLLASFFIKENVPSQAHPPKLMALLRVAKDRNLLTMSLLAILPQTILFGTMHTFTPLVASALNASSQQLGYLSTLGNIPRIVAALLCGLWLARRANIKRLLALSFVMLAVGSAVTPFCPNIPLLYAASMITGFGSGISMTIFMSLCVRSIDDARRSAAMGFFQAIYGVGMFLGPVAVGFFTDTFGIIWAFLFSAAVAIIGLAGSLALVEN